MRVLRAGLAAFLLLLLGVVPAALAQGPLEIASAYPSVVADPGATVSFDSTVTTDTPQRVDLSITQQPDGWATRLSGGGSTIAAVSTAVNPDANNAVQATFTVETDVPSDAPAGTYTITVQGRTASGATAQLSLDVQVATAEQGSVELATDFPSLQGPTSTNFRFNVSLRNHTNQQITFGLETDSPAGWTVSAQPTTSEQATTAVVNAGATEAINVTAKAPSDTAAGDYTIVVRAVGGPQPVETPLTVTITGTYSLSMDTSDQALNARVTAGNSSVLNIIVSNTGSSDLTNVKMTATPPRDWQVTFDEDTIPSIPANQQVTIAATIAAASDAISGDYLITFNARAAETGASDSMEIRTTVDTSQLGYLIGIAVLVLVGVGLFFVFQRYGRR